MEQTQATIQEAFFTMYQALEEREDQLLDTLKTLTTPWNQAYYNRRAHYTLALEGVVNRLDFSLHYLTFL